MGNGTGTDDDNGTKLDFPKPVIKALQRICQDAAQHPDALMRTYEIAVIRMGDSEEWVLRMLPGEKAEHLRW